MLMEFSYYKVNGKKHLEIILKRIEKEPVIIVFINWKDLKTKA